MATDRQAGSFILLWLPESLYCLQPLSELYTGETLRTPRGERGGCERHLQAQLSNYKQGCCYSARTRKWTFLNSIMATSEVYTSTTVAEPKSSCFLVPSENLDKTRFLIKIIQVLLSFVAFVLEEVVNSCISCSALYFFEFISCTAFLFTLLLLILLATALHTKVGITCWPRLDFGYTAVIGVFFLIASIVFAADNSQSALECSAVAFGFLSSVAFFVDLFFFWKNSGFPFKNDGKPEPANGNGNAVATMPATPAETEKLTAAANRTE
ncbi:hypothetical protein LDENG_00085740 [Lucifuga dentata]|nr:hypothetical protein LDENG_00085740 [Lucifuga dentata]